MSREPSTKKKGKPKAGDMPPPMVCGGIDDCHSWITRGSKGFNVEWVQIKIGNTPSFWVALFSTTVPTFGGYATAVNVSIDNPTPPDDPVSCAVNFRVSVPTDKLLDMMYPRGYYVGLLHKKDRTDDLVSVEYSANGSFKHGNMYRVIPLNNCDKEHPQYNQCPVDLKTKLPPDNTYLVTGSITGFDKDDSLSGRIVLAGQ